MWQLYLCLVLVAAVLLAAASLFRRPPSGDEWCKGEIRGGMCFSKR
jgi:hypothetical protein